MVRVIAGIARGALLKTRKGEGTRPTSDKVKGALFNILGPVLTGTLFLDLFAGSGAIGIEALSRGTALAVFVEKEFLAVRDMKANLEKTGFTSQSRVLKMDVTRALGLLGRERSSFTHIFMDPPYGNSSLINSVLKDIWQNQLLQRRGVVIVEHGAGNCSWKPGPFDLYRQRIYGDTALSFLRASEKGEIFS